MTGVKSLVQIAGEQTSLSDRILVAVRIVATITVLVLALAAGRPLAALIDGGVLLVIIGMSAPIIIILLRGKSSEFLYLPSLIVDAVVLMALAGTALSGPSMDNALPSLFVGEIYCLSIALLAGFRVSLRDCVLATCLNFLVPAFVVVYAILRFPASSAIQLLFVPFINGIAGSLATIACNRYESALRENLVT